MNENTNINCNEEIDESVVVSKVVEGYQENKEYTGRKENTELKVIDGLMDKIVNNASDNSKSKDKETKNTKEKNPNTSADKSKNTNTTETSVPNTKSSNGYGKYSYSYKKKNYDYMGKRNRTLFKDFIKICKFTQKDIKIWLQNELLNSGYEDVVYGDGYIYAKGTIPILLTAHMDTVHKKTVESFYDYHDKDKKRHILSSPEGIGGDDRCGIYMILEIIKTHKCSVLFCEDEERGGIGSDKFCKTDLINELSELKYLIELDRANGTDAVFYDCDNEEFTKFIEDNTGYKESWGSFSDISTLCPSCGVAGVNLSCGYYNAHSTSEYVVVEEMMNTIEVVKKLLEVECKQFEYVEALNVYGRGRYSSIYGYDYYDYYDDYYGYGCYSDNHYSNRNNKTSKRNSYRNSNRNLYKNQFDKKFEMKNEQSFLFYALNKETSFEGIYVSNASSLDEALGKFFRENPEYCFNDIMDWDESEDTIYGDGWFYF